MNKTYLLKYLLFDPHFQCLTYNPIIINPQIINNVVLGKVFLGGSYGLWRKYLITKRSLKGKYSMRNQRQHWRLLNRLQLAVVREMKKQTKKARSQQKKDNEKYQKMIFMEHFYLHFTFPNISGRGRRFSFSGSYLDILRYLFQFITIFRLHLYKYKYNLLRFTYIFLSV